jgi:hypothetical protein
MSALSIQVPFPVFQDRDGQPLENGYIWIGQANLNPQTNPVVAYYDSALTIVAPQPLRTLNGYISRAGTPAQVYINAVNFSILVQDSKGSMVYNFPDGSGISANASGIVYDPPFTGSVITNVEAKLAQTVSVKDFGAVGDNSTDDTAAIQNAINSLSVNGSLYIPKTSTAYLTTATLTVTKPIRIYGDGVGSLIRKTTAGDALHIDGTGVANQLSGIILENFAVSTEVSGSGGDAIQLTNVGRSSVSNIYIPSSVSAGIRSFGSAYITYTNVVISSNLPYTVGTRALPAAGIALQVNAVTGIASGHNSFIDCQVASTLNTSPSVGFGVFVAQYCSHNLFINGSYTVANYGMLFEQDAELNTVIGCVLEENEIIDYQVGGHRNTFINAQGFSIALGGAAGGILFLSTAYNNSVYGGRYRTIYTNAGCVGTVLNNPSTFALVDNGTQTQQYAIWDIANSKYLTNKVIYPSVNWSNGGMTSVRVSQNPNKLVSLGFDASYFDYGVGYINTVFDGTANVPLALNPGGGRNMLGVASADPGGSNNLAIPPGTTPTLNHTGITLFTTDGLSPKFMDKNGIVRTITFT